MKQLRTQQNAWGHRRVELDGVHFISQGQAVVIDEQRIWVGLAKCDAFGMSQVIREIVS